MAYSTVRAIGYGCLVVNRVRGLVMPSFRQVVMVRVLTGSGWVNDGWLGRIRSGWVAGGLSMMKC